MYISIVITKADEFHLRYLFESEAACARQLSRYVIIVDDGGEGKRNKKSSQRWKRGRAGPSISAPLITFSHRGI